MALLLLAGGAALGAGVPALAQTYAPEAVADSVFGAWLTEQGAPGGVLGVVRAGELILARGYGVRSLADPTAPGPATRFCIASVTKAITAFAVLLLCDEGRLRLDAPASTWLPELPESWRGITVRQFLCHVSGIPSDGLLRRPDWAGAMAAAARLRARPPGLRVRYNNFNYVVAGQLIERASGQDYAGFVTSRVLAPLGMARAGVGEGADPDQARGYWRTGRGLVEPELWAGAGPHYDPAGRIFASLSDLLAFAGALRGGRLLSPGSLAEIFRPYGPGLHGTCGWFAKTSAGQPYLLKLGRVGGFSTDMEITSAGDALVMMWNLQAGGDRSNRPRAELRKRLLDLGSGEPETADSSVQDEHNA